MPPAYTVDANGKPLHSWRVLILPYVDAAPLYAQIDLFKPWDDPANAEAAKAMPHTYGCPSVNAEPGMTTYLAAAGQGSCFQPGHSRPLSEITDGTSNTLMVIEVTKAQAVHWMAPQDADVTLLLGLGQAGEELHHTGGMHGLLADGGVRWFSVNTSEADLRAIFTVAGNDVVSYQF